MPDVIVTVNQTYVNEAFANVLCFNNFIEDETFLQEFADVFRASYVDSVEAEMSESWILENIDVSFLLSDSIDYTVKVDFTDGPLTGGSMGDALPPNAPLLISTSFVGSRPNRGRIYFSGLPESAQNNGIYSTGARAPFETLVTVWKDGLPTSEGSHFLRILRRPSMVFPSYVSSAVSFVTSTGGAKNQRRRSRD